MDGKDIALIKALGGGGSGGSGGSVTVDSALSDTSTNPVQNKVIKSALDAKLAKSGIAAKTDDMTQSVGVDAAGGLWVKPGSGGSGVKMFNVLNALTLESGVAYVEKTETDQGVSYLDAGIDELIAVFKIIGNPDLSATTRVVVSAVKETGEIEECLLFANALFNTENNYRVLTVKITGLQSDMCYMEGILSSTENWVGKNGFTIVAHVGRIVGLRFVGGFGTQAFGKNSELTIWGR